ncbi:MAG: ferrous iron transport protein B [Bacteroidota bacterium]
MKIALLGNPNTGKSSIFNLLTGLRQTIGNFPGVTVEKRTGVINVSEVEHQLTDFPGVYSIYPRTKDEEVVYSALTNQQSTEHPELAIYVADASNLERNLLFFTQLYDLNIPLILVLNMWDVASKRGIEIDIEKLKNRFVDVEIITANARVGLGKKRILDAINNWKASKRVENIISNYKPAAQDDQQSQAEEANNRFFKIKEINYEIENRNKLKSDTFSRKVDRVLLHPVLGYVIFLGILLLVFQFIFSFASIPMDFIEGLFVSLGSWFSDTLPKGMLSDLISQGIIPGIGGVLVFIPQIALLFFFISILEETGYLARVVFIMDRIMRPLGLNGKSVVPLMSSAACAIPGIMSARTIADWKERMITILVAPLMSCSARIPVYTLLISLVIPNQKILGVINLQGIVLFCLYILGIVAAIFVSLLLNQFIGTREKGFLLLELPSYRSPRWTNVGINILEKVKVFVLDAGKIILAISIILWALATFGPSGRMEKSERKLIKTSYYKSLSYKEKQQQLASVKLESSFIGIMGKSIEPIIKPLGFDWKIGISLITSFAAREVFVGSLATIYAVNNDSESNLKLIEKMRNEKNNQGNPVYSLASGTSLMIFYVFAMQCMATLAVVKRETQSWKWPIIQILYMGFLAYFGSFLCFQLLS